MTYQYTDGSKALGHDLDIARLADILAPGEHDLVAVIEAYFDESADDASGLLCVAGYIFKKSKAKQMDLKWRRMLLRYELPYFRMSACAHGAKPFDHLSPSQRIAVATEAIELIKSHASVGVANTLNARVFESVVPKEAFGNGPYEFLVWNCLMGVRTYLDVSQQKGKVAYFFEAGHASQSKANALMNEIFIVPELCADYHYSAHGFVPKVKSRLSQAADLLAWQYLTDRKHQIAGRRRRKDLESLLSVQHLVRHVDEARHAEVCKELIASAGMTSRSGQSS